MTGDRLIQVDAKGIESLGLSLETLAEDLAPELLGAMVNTVTGIEKYAKFRCPVNTGRLRASITPEIQGFREGAVGTNVDYAAAVEYGGRPHDIRPRKAKALRFTVGGTGGRYVTTKGGKKRWQKGKPGEPVFVTRVKHPGTKAQPFLEPAFVVGAKVAEKEFGAAVERAVGKAKAKLKENA